MIYLQLFLSFFQVGLFSVGGGYAAIPLIQNQVVTMHGWLSMSEFIDLITIAEMTPGPIAINSATFVGIRVGGIPGALIATFGCITPSIILVSLLAYIYFKYKETMFLKNILKCLRPTVVALIAGAGLSILFTVVFKETVSLKSLNGIGLAVFLAALFALRKWRTNPILTMVVCGVVSTVLNLLIPSLF